MALHLYNVNNIYCASMFVNSKKKHISPLVWAAPPESRAQQWPVAFQRINAPMVVLDPKVCH